MSVVGIGTDLVKIARVRSAVERHGARFAERVLMPVELAEWRARADGTRYLAKRWAVKEATAKALGTGIGAALAFHDIQVVNAANGQPGLRLDGIGAATAERLRIRRWHVSISDEADLALAFVVAESA